MHSNSFLFGPFDGTGWFARKVDEAAAAGVLWVNSAGNYRLRHWEGAWSDADADGNLDVPGTATPSASCCPPPAGPPATLVERGERRGHGQLLPPRAYQDAAPTLPALDKKTGLPIASSGLDALTDPHADMPPGALAAGGTYYLAVTRVGNPATAT